jgi:hypothetical protein
MYGKLSRVGWDGFAGIAAAAALPFLTFVADNPAEPLPLRWLGIYWLVIVGVIGGVVAVIGSRRGAAIAAVSLYLFFSFSVVETLEAKSRFEGVLGIDGSLIILVGLLLGTAFLTRFRWTHAFISIAALLFLIPPALQIAFSSPLEPAAPPLSVADALDLTPESRPNIWWFVLDGYGRGDVLRAEYPGADVDTFEDALQARGFHIADQAVANYSHTYLSIAATLQMDLLVKEGDDIENREPFYSALQGDNRVVSTLRHWGYSYAHAPANGWEGSECSGLEDACVNASLLSEADVAVISMTPLKLLQRGTWSAATQSYRTNPVEVVKSVEAYALPQPLFVFAHMLTPHPPYVRTAECAPQSSDGSWGTREDYAASVTCLNRLMIEAIDRILEADPDALILVQGDHGPPHEIKMGDGDPHDWSARDIRRRLGVMSASRLPNDCAMPADIHLVNTFRSVFDCLSEESVEPLAARNWIANYSDYYLLEVGPSP